MTVARTGKSARSTGTSGLSRAYEGLSGPGLLEKLADDGRFDVLEAFWRYGDPGLCAALVDPVLRVGAPVLVAFLVGDILNPTIGEPFPTRLAQGLANRRPPLRGQSASRLAERLREPEPLANPQYEQSRHVLEMWILGQDGKVADEFAIDVVAGRTPKSGVPEVRDAAYGRCNVSQYALQGASKLVLAQLEESPSSTTWQTATDFLEGATEGKASPPAPLVPVVEKLLELAPSHAPVDAFTPQLARFAAGPQRSVLKRLISAHLQDAPGARAVLRTLPAIPHPGTKARLFALAVRRQPHLWGVLQAETSTWDESAWERNLKALVGQEPIEPGILTQLLSSAPLTLIVTVIKLALAQAQAPGEPPLQTAGQRLRQRLDDLGRGQEQESAWVEAVPWSLARGAGAKKLGSVLTTLEVEDRVRLVRLAFLEGKARANTAAQLLPDGASYEALVEVADEERRAALAQALAAVRPDEAADAISRLQGETFSLEVAGALAPSLPTAAFSGAQEAWPALSPAEKDSLVDLLCSHAAVGQIPVLEAIVADDHRENAQRRAKAARRIADLVPAGERPPQCVTDLLSSNIERLREAAVDAIKAIRPRDPQLIAKLHEVAKPGGDPGKAAVEALDALAEQFLSEMDRASTKDEIRELIPLLGAVGRPRVLSRLFRFLGASAEYDDVALHRAAAKAVLQAADHIDSVSEQDQTTLVALIDGEEREADPEALDDLSAALARIQLGEDAALKILYDELDFPVRASPDDLFGSEKGPLVRQLALYARFRDLGEAGWGVALAHLDNIAERLVRAAYLVCRGGSESIKTTIRSDPRKPNYGTLIGALSSVKELKAIQDDCSKLHDIRSRFSEVAHPGEQPDQATWTTAHHCFKEIAKVCVGVLMGSAQQSGG